MDLQKAYDSVEWTTLESIMKELRFPPKFTRWIMLVVSTVSYRYNINGERSGILKSRRGLRQGDPFFPCYLLFVIVMEYLHRVMKQMNDIPNFNFYSKCEKLQLINLSFMSDLLIFTRGDPISVQLSLQCFKEFSISTGLVVNPNKCRVYCGNAPLDDQQTIMKLSSFPWALCRLNTQVYLSISNKKLYSNHCMILVKKLWRELNIGLLGC